MQKKKEIGVMDKRDLISQHEDSKFIANINENIKTDLIVITKDKLENRLLKICNSICKRPDWKTPLSIFITTALTLLTADFKDFLINKEVWQVLFFLIMLISSICCLVNLIRAIKNPKSDSIDDLINLIVNSEEDGSG